jgi:hypothetical protein
MTAHLGFGGIDDTRQSVDQKAEYMIPINIVSILSFGSFTSREDNVAVILS